MPGLDKTGPLGQGSSTGRKKGLCNAGTEKKAGAFFSRGWVAACRAGRGNRKMTGDGSTPGRGLGRFRRPDSGRQG